MSCHIIRIYLQFFNFKLNSVKIKECLMSRFNTHLLDLLLESFLQVLVTPDQFVKNLFWWGERHNVNSDIHEKVSLKFSFGKLLIISLSINVIDETDLN